MKEQSSTATSYKFTVERDGKIAGRASLFLISNELHEKPYGLLEDVFVELSFRKEGIGTELTQAVIQKAKDLGCYKLVATSRNERPKVHEMYEKFGFTKYGVAFRMDF